MVPLHEHYVQRGYDDVCVTSCYMMQETCFHESELKTCTCCVKASKGGAGGESVNHSVAKDLCTLSLHHTDSASFDLGQENMQSSMRPFPLTPASLEDT